MNDLFTRRMKRRIWRAIPATQAMLLHHTRKRQVAKLRRLPPWADLAAIEAVYQLARAMTTQTGIEHHVDHKFPLQGRLVCGLHVAANLQVVPATVNLQKHNRLPDDPETWLPLPLPAATAQKTNRKANTPYHQMFPNSIMRKPKRPANG